MSEATATIRLLLADTGEFHEADIRVPAAAIERYDRLIDLLQEEPAVLRTTYVDLRRLCSARLVTPGEDGS